jgi:hypothetical protein
LAPVSEGIGACDAADMVGCSLHLSRTDVLFGDSHRGT